MSKPRIGISLRVVIADTYNEKRDALSQDWSVFLEKLNCNPIFIPNTLSDVKSYLQDLNINGIILSGGDNIGENLERDRTEKIILDYAVENKIPVIGICRGMQVVNNYFGGSIETSKNSDHVRKDHVVDITNESFSSFFKSQFITVNSYHNNLIQQNNCGSGLEAFAITQNDNSVEGFFHTSLPIIGVMWHPERNINNISELLFRKAFQNIMVK